MTTDVFTRKLAAVLSAGVKDYSRIYGDGVNVAARLEGLGEAGGLVTAS